jgi:hypothetical protein
MTSECGNLERVVEVFERRRGFNILVGISACFSEREGDC